MLTRRTFIKSGAAVVAGAVLPIAGVEKAFAAPLPTPLPASSITPFVDPLPIPPVKTPIDPGGTAFALSVEPLQHKYHRDLNATTMWGYDGIYPGPTFLATRGTPITVAVTNNLTGPHPFQSAFDATIPGNVDDGRIAVHMHGGENAPASDGNPADYFLPGADPKVYEYGNSQKGATLWYHDHALGNTRLNVMAGLAGFYLLVDPDEDQIARDASPGHALPFISADPALTHTIGLAIQDRDFFDDGSVNYPTVPDPTSGHDHWVPEYFANTACVNGKAMPYLDVEPRRYRFLVLNGSQARFYNLSLSNGGSFTVIGSDGGYLAHPSVQTKLLIAPGERYDVVIDFTESDGDEIVMTNDAVGPYPSGTLFTDPSITDTSMKVMKFRVNKALTAPLNLPVPPVVPTIAATEVPAGVLTRSLFLNEVANSSDAVLRVMLDNTGSMEPATEIPQVGATEIWEIANTTGDTHPIHLHLVQFRLLSRQKFNSDAYEALALSTGYYPPVSRFLTSAAPMMGRTPRAQESAWKDTVLMHPDEVTRILVRFAPQEGTYPVGTIGFNFDPTVEPGYVWHCHILEHEENDMMRPLILSQTYAGGTGRTTLHRSASTIHVNHEIRLYGTVTPGKLGDLVTVQLKRPGSKVFTNLRSLYTTTMSGAGSGYTTDYKPLKRGSYSARVRFGGTADRRPYTSPTVTFKVV